MKLIANKEMYYDRRMVQAEEEFDCDERFVNVLLLSQSARKAEEDGGRRKNRGYKRRDMTAEDR